MSAFRLSNTSGITAGAQIAVFAELLNQADVPTLCHAAGGINNASTTGGTVTGRRAAPAIATHLRVTHSNGSALLSGTLRLVGSKTRQAG